MHSWNGKGAFVRDGIREVPIDIFALRAVHEKREKSKSSPNLRNFFLFFELSLN